jgi:uncharacterized protein YbcI
MNEGASHAALFDGARGHNDGTLGAAAEDGRHGSALLQISNAMVRLYKEAFGRGPTKARAQFAGPDTLVVLLQDSMTVAERNLAAMDEHSRIRSARMFFQHALEDEFRAAVEQILGRRTIAFVSGIDSRRDLSVEVFTLEPRPVDSDGRPADSNGRRADGDGRPAENNDRSADDPS